MTVTGNTRDQFHNKTSLARLSASRYRLRFTRHEGWHQADEGEGWSTLSLVYPNLRFFLWRDSPIIIAPVSEHVDGTSTSFARQEVRESRTMRQIHRSIRTIVVLLLPALTVAPSACAQATDRPTPGPAWKLVWSDEFNQTDGAAPDPTKWSIQTGGDGFGNSELEYYTSRIDNAHISGGTLVITAKKETFTGSDSVTRQYTSARMQSKNKFQQQYGRFEARIKLPGGGQGLWPAFWMLGNDIDRVSWPACGEIDIMEEVGFEPSIVHGSLHGPGYSGANPLTGTFSLSHDQRFSANFHVFAVEWEPAAIRFYVDNVLYETQTPQSIPNKHWVFDHPFFLLLNLAVGGAWPGNPDATTVFPSSMLVDYVRVYRRISH